jgi:hypothetical protein
MNGKPKSQRAVQLAAFHCTHPDLDAADSALLAYLALNADFKTGKNSRPGNSNTADMLKFEKRGTINILTENIKRGLIERTLKGNGRGIASVFRLCLENDYYPDQTPSGEELSDKSAPGCTDNPISVHEDAGKGAPPSQEVCTGMPERVHPGATHHLPTRTPPPTTTTQNGGGGFSSQESATLDAKYLVEKCPKLAFGKEAELDALIQEHGYSVVNAALFRCSKQSYDGVNNPIAVTFSTRLPKMIAEIKEEKASEASHKKTQETITVNIKKQCDELDNKNRTEHERIQKENAEQDARLKAFLESGGNHDDIL